MSLLTLIVKVCGSFQQDCRGPQCHYSQVNGVLRHISEILFFFNNFFLYFEYERSYDIICFSLPLKLCKTNLSGLRIFNYTSHTVNKLVEIVFNPKIPFTARNGPDPPNTEIKCVVVVQYNSMKKIIITILNE